MPDRRKTDPQRLFVIRSDTVLEALSCMAAGAEGIVVVVDADRRFIGSLREDDIWLALSRGVELSAAVRDALEPEAFAGSRFAVAAAPDASPSECRRLMEESGVDRLPVVDDDRQVRGVVSLEELEGRPRLPVLAVVMAGGFGRRLRPLTEFLPKPMLPLGDRPVMEYVLGRLARAGVRRAVVTAHYLPDRIREHFGDGSRFGLDLEYVVESQPLGTAGALGLMPKPSEPALVVNGDVLARIDYADMLRFHTEHDAALTVAARRHEVTVPYGVLECEGDRVRTIREKPSVPFMVNAGMYLLSPAAFDLIDPGEHVDMTDLMARALERDLRVLRYEMSGYWLDIGHRDDYERANEDLLNRMHWGRGR